MQAEREKRREGGGEGERERTRGWGGGVRLLQLCDQAIKANKISSIKF